jgi:hypothetical protein
LKPESSYSVDLFFIAFFEFRQMDGASDRPSGRIYGRRFDHRGLGRYRTNIQI